MTLGPVAGSVAAIARDDPGRTALIHRDEAISYARLDEAARRMAGWLLRQGVRPGEMVGLTLRDDLLHMTVALALLRMGCGQVALASHDTAAMRAETAARLGVRTILGDSDADSLPGLSLLTPEPAGPAPDIRPETQAGETLLVLTSSGTTGRPKLIPLTEADLAAQGDRRRHEGPVAYRSVSCEHNNGKKFRLLLLSTGGTALLPAGIGLEHLAEACARHAVDFVTLQPARGEALADLHAAGAASAPWPARTRLGLSGAAVTPGVRRKIMAALTPHLYVSYSTTECGGITQAGPGDHGDDPDSVGRPMPGVEVRIVDEAGAPLPPGALGRVRVRTPGMARGYLDDPEATARLFRDGWFQPGDMGRLLPDGRLVFAGRDSEMMVLGTINVFAAEIERAAEGFPGLAACAAFPIRSAAVGDIPALAAVETSPGALDTAALLARCRERLGVRAPRRVVVVSALPRNAVGKVQRDRLATLAADATGDPSRLS